jgi:hypothetical protein
MGFVARLLRRRLTVLPSQHIPSAVARFTFNVLPDIPLLPLLVTIALSD